MPWRKYERIETMKKNILTVWLFLVVIGGLNINALAAGESKSTAKSLPKPAPALDARKHFDFDFDWKFIKGEVANAQAITIDESGWAGVQLPHDWSIEGPFDKKNPAGKRGGFLPGGIGWYRKHFQLSPQDKDKKIFIQFDGIYQNSEVWINGHSLGIRPYGYTSFQRELTPYVKFGADNVLAVRVDNSDQPNSRWYTGSGIYRHVWLTVTDKLHVDHWGTYVTTPQISPDKAIVRVRTKIKNSYDQTKNCSLVTIILNGRGQVVAKVSTPYSVSTQSVYEVDQKIEVLNPALWSIDSPALYSARSVLKDEQSIYDEYETSFGIREIRFDKDKGFLINGQSVKMKGVCIHHDAGCLGAAVPDRALERRLEVLKSIGCNAIRTSHNPPSPELLDMCDRMGFVVIDEAFDKWGGSVSPWFTEWWKMDLQDMLQRDRNHPSVILWSMGNEVKGQGSPKFMKQLKKMVEFTHQFEPTRPVTLALRPEKIKSRRENARFVANIAKAVDVICCNYQEQWFEDYRKEYPEIVIIASESYVYYRGKGDTHKAFEPLNPWLETAKHDYVVGTFYWTGIDYLGEAGAGWPYHGWNCSLIDTCGFVRPVSYLQKSFWSDKPMVHIAVMDDSLDVPIAVKAHWGWPKMASHWNLPQLNGKEVKVVTFTNCPAVELLLNGKSVGTKQLEDFPDKMITWKVAAQPGKIEARGIEKGKTVCSHQLQTAGKATQIHLIADRKTIRADGRDLCNIEVKVTDEQGILVPGADHLINFTIQGPGNIIGVDNGDVTSMEPYKAGKRRVFHGRALLVLQSTLTPGKLTLEANGEGLAKTKVVINADALAAAKERPAPNTRERKIPLSNATSSWGYYGVTPESPDEKRLCYALYPEPTDSTNDVKYPEHPAELWVCNIDGTGHRRLFKGNSSVHNGLMQSWVDNKRIVFASDGDIRIINADTGKVVFGPFEGFSPGHYALGGKVLMYQKENFTKPRGIYEFDTATGKMRLAVPYNDRIWHVQCSTDGKTILFRTRDNNYNALGVADLESGSFKIFPGEKPMHFQWFDKQSFFGYIVPNVIGGDPNTHLMHEMYRWNLDGEIIEHLAGYGCHGAARADGKYFAGESWYGSDPIVLRLYSRGQRKPLAEIFSHHFVRPTWQNGRHHVNPSFSRDGMRLYYKKAVNENTSHAFSCDLTGLVEPMSQVDRRKVERDCID